MAHEDICMKRKRDLTSAGTVMTKHGKMKVYRDWNCEGALYMKEPQTIKRYKEIQKEEPDSDEYGIFWAFSQEQFDEGVDKMIEKGLFKKGEKIYSIGAGGYGVNKYLIDDFFNFYKNRSKRIAAECDPQEVYIYEWNEHECMFDFDDSGAYDVVVSIFGKEIAEGITRFTQFS